MTIAEQQLHLTGVKHGLITPESLEFVQDNADVFPGCPCNQKPWLERQGTIHVGFESEKGGKCTWAACLEFEQKPCAGAEMLHLHCLLKTVESTGWRHLPPELAQNPEAAFDDKARDDLASLEYCSPACRATLS